MASNQMEAPIRDLYARMHTELATYHPWFKRWSANSMYGYTLEWQSSKEAAERYVIDYYTERPHLILD